MRAATVVAAIAVGGGVASAQVSRTEVIDRAKAFTYYPWRAQAANLTASCKPGYKSAFVVGDFLGVAYDWGGFDSLFQFSQKLAGGYGAGTPAGGDVVSCTTGVDCSGFVSRTWKTTSKYGTSTLPQISSVIAASALLPGDIFNDAGNHVTLFSHLLANGQPYMYEAYGFNTRVNATGGFSWVTGYTPRRYQQITGTTVANPAGTLANPIVIGALPFADTRDTRTAPSSVLDGCGAAPTANETGPEYVYRVTITQPGTLTVAVADDASTDVDVHLYTSANTSDCVARHDSALSRAVDCGTYYVVADTFGGAGNAGSFDLTVTHAPNGQPCGGGPPTYDPLGGLGDACAFPGNANLPSCNPTLDAEVCLFTSGAGATSFCSKACATSADCADLPGGAGCCEELASGERYCLRADFCGSDPPPPPDDPQDPPPPPDEPGEPDEPGNPSHPDPDAPGERGGCAAVGAEAGAPWLVLAFAFAFSRRRRGRSP